MASTAPTTKRVITKKCAFPYCDFNGQSRYFRIPKNEERRKKWLEACKLENVKERDVICERHFKPTDFQNNPNKLLLMPGAIPVPFTTEEVFEESASTLANFVVSEEINSSALSTNDATTTTVSNDEIPSVDELDCANLLPSMGNEHDYAFMCESCQNSSFLLKKIERLRQDVLYWRRKFHNLEKKHDELKNMPNSPSPKALKFRDQITKERLLSNGNFSVPQIDVMLRFNKKDNKNPRSRKWTKQDLLNSKKLLGQCGKKSLRLVREMGFPLPSESTCYDRFKFLKVDRGFVKPSLLYLESIMPRLPLREQIASVKFDEIKLSNLALYDARLDAISGPNNYAQTILVRSIFGSWSFPIFIDYDMALTKLEYNECILHLEAIGVKVHITTCDQGPRNQSLANELGVTMFNVEVPNPFDDTRSVYFSYDIVHCIKNLRSHLLDDYARLDGREFAKEDFEELLRKVNSVSFCVSKLTPRHINCTKSDRQNVQLAKELLSNSTSILLKNFFPDCPNKRHLSYLIDVLDKGWNIMTSKMSNAGANDFSKAPFSEHLDQQLACLQNLIGVVECLEFKLRNPKSKKEPKWSTIPSQKGAIISIRCMILLQECLAKLYNEPIFGGDTVIQDDLERYFGEIRDLHGPNDNPNALQYNNRVCCLIIQAILEDDNFDIFSLVSKLENCNKYAFDYTKLNSEFEAEATTQELNLDEVYWVAGYLAFKTKDPSLADDSSKQNHDDQDVTGCNLFLTKSLKEGTIFSPSKEFLNDVRKMYELFASYHPLPNLKQGPGLHSDFLKILSKEFPHLKSNVLKEFTVTRTNFQIKLLNQLAAQGKRLTLRGAKNLATTINS